MKTLALALTIFLGASSYGQIIGGRESGGAEGMTASQIIYDHLEYAGFTVIDGPEGIKSIHVLNLTCIKPMNDFFSCYGVDRTTKKKNVIKTSPSFGNLIADELVGQPDSSGFFEYKKALEIHLSEVHCKKISEEQTDCEFKIKL